jgi:hypothetical protein
MPKAAGMQLLTSDSEQPRRASPWGRADFDNDSVCRAAPVIDEVGDLSNDQRKKSKPRQLEQSPKSKRKNTHHTNSSSIHIRPPFWSRLIADSEKKRRFGLLELNEKRCDCVTLADFSVPTRPLA